MVCFWDRVSHWILSLIARLDNQVQHLPVWTDPHAPSTEVTDGLCQPLASSWVGAGDLHPGSSAHAWAAWAKGTIFSALDALLLTALSLPCALFFYTWSPYPICLVFVSHTVDCYIRWIFMGKFQLEKKSKPVMVSPICNIKFRRLRQEDYYKSKGIYILSSKLAWAM